MTIDYKQKELVAGLIEGNNDAYLEFVLKYGGFIKNVLKKYYFLDDKDDAYQEVLIMVFRKIGTFRGEADLRTWLYPIITGIANQKTNKNRKYNILSSDLIELKDGNNPEKEYLKKERLEDIERAINEIHNTKRRRLLKLFLRGDKVGSIQKGTTYTLKAVKSYIHHGKMELREILKEKGYNGKCSSKKV